MNQSNNQDGSADTFAHAQVSDKKSFSPVWILPIVAFLIGVGLVIESYLSAGIMITLQVPSAEGIVVGKTKVLYKGIATGIVKDRTVTKDLQNIVLHIEMDKRTERVLHDNAQFWVVEPRISLSGVSGLDTIIGGRYIAIDVNEDGEPKRDFIALNAPPPPTEDTPGLHLKLRLNRLESIERGTKIYYKQIPVGEVTNYTLEENDTEIHAWVLIEPEYAHLVKENSHFYNVSGVKINAGLSGVKIETESLISVIAGGVAFYNPVQKEEAKAAKNGQFYQLYSDFEAAKVGVPIVFRFKNTDELQEHVTEIKFQGRVIGRIGAFSYDQEKNEVIVLASINPLMENALTDNTQFWVVKPSVSLLKITGLDALLSGNYIQMRPSLKGRATREFDVLESTPPLSIAEPGLHVNIESNTLGSIDINSPIHFKNIVVGHIDGYRLSDDSSKVQLKAFIKPEFSHLVKKNSHFYNVSGLNISGGVSGIKVQTESLAAILKGGIAFYTPEFEGKQAQSENGDQFVLYKDYDEAKAGLEISLTFTTATGLTEGITKVIYKGLVIGLVQEVIPNGDKKTVTAKVTLDPIAEGALVDDTKFWMVKPKISLGEVKNLETLFGGNYVTLRLGTSQKKRHIFPVSQDRPPYDKSYPGLHLKLRSSNLGSISVGAPVMYNRIKIGDIQDYELAKDRKNINILIHIWPQYTDIVHSNSRFYNASGFQIDASFAGIDVHTESVESILKGGISLYNDPDDSGKKAVNDDFYTLFEDFDAAQMNAFYVKVQFKDAKGLAVGSKVSYKNISVGKVHSIQLSRDKANSVWVSLELDSLLQPKLGSQSRFWVKTAKLGLTKTENLDTLVQGSYITVQPIKAQLKEKNPSFFIGLEEKPLTVQSSSGFSISLTASRLSSVKIGDPVYYRQVKVGTVIGYELADTADQILIHLSIRNRFKPLIRENSQFWHASGIAVDINLFGTSTIRTESLEAIIAGGISFATPDNAQMGKMLPPGSFFVLHNEPKKEWTQWNPIIRLKKETLQD
ncbi:MAG: MCE family protein [Gammaproteobacteria bacterium]|nr:MCE family protein [Gammaproteobacteria bacterium]